MDYCWYLVSDAHVGPTVVVEVDVALNDLVGVFKRVEALLPVDTLTFPVD